MISRVAVGILLILTAGSLIAAPTVSPEALRAAGAISRGALEAPIRMLASDLFEGRGPASRGDELTRLYLENEMRELDLEPAAADGTFQQKFEMVGITSRVPAEWHFSAGGAKKLTLAWSKEFIAGSGVQSPAAAVRDSELVFVGYGIQAPEYNWDDFKGVDLRGKTLVFLNNDPDWDPKLFEGERRLYYGRWSYKYESAARQGAAGAIIIHTVPSAGYPWRVVQTSWSGEQFELPARDEPRIQLKAWITEKAAADLFRAGGHDLEKLVASARSRKFKPVPLRLTTTLEFENALTRVETANVLGLLRGSDEQLRDEVVVYTAHHDHLGIGEPDENGDTIYNGALDNATGVAQLLAIARAFTSLETPPRRSVLFLFVGAEEQGLLGSAYYAAHPTFHPGKIAANINFDGGNVWGRTRDLTLIGHGKSTLDEVATRYATMQGRVVKPDQFPDRGFYYRSDQFSFAKIGVPALYFDSGTDFHDHEGEWGRARAEEFEKDHYHQPSDEFDESWTFDGMIEDAQIGFYAGLEIANSDQMPSWRPGDEFEATRARALAEANSITASD
jgi:Zn-dependent M28 family amino/carboxypeptidase